MVNWALLWFPVLGPTRRSVGCVIENVYIGSQSHPYRVLDVGIDDLKVQCNVPTVTLSN
jgi:hypothetical protein